MIKRRDVISLLCFCLLGCSVQKPPLEKILPTKAGDFTLQSSQAINPQDAPELVRQLGLNRASMAAYSGRETISVRVFEMNVATSAFELIQKWRQGDGLAVYSGPYFIVA